MYLKTVWPNSNPPPTHYPSVCAFARRVRHIKCCSKPMSVEWEWVIKPSNSESASVLTSPAALPDRTQRCVCPSGNKQFTNSSCKHSLINCNVNNLMITSYFFNLCLVIIPMHFIIKLCIFTDCCKN